MFIEVLHTPVLFDFHCLTIMLLLCHSLLAGTRRKLSFQNPSAAAMEGFRLRQLDSIFGLADVPAPNVGINAAARSAVM
jgi:hypothetical protein